LKKIIYHFILLHLILLNSYIVQGQSDYNLISTSKQWLSINFYIKEGQSISSLISNDSFFLSTDGKNNPLNELEASIQLFKSKTTSENINIKCKYPVRYKFLLQYNLINSHFDFTAHCSGYKSWQSKYKFTSVSLIMPAAYMNSPSSVFGHTFLRLNNNTIPKNKSISINYVAKLPSNISFIDYIKGGMSGDFVGQFKLVPYHIKLREYNYVENRNIWEFQLNISPIKLSHISDVLWQLKYAQFKYYFFDYNCSYMILAFLQIIDSQFSISDLLPFYTLPSDTVDILYERNLIDSSTYIPSSLTKFSTTVSKFDADTKEIIFDLALGKPINNDFYKLPTIEKQNILQASINLIDILVQDQRITRTQGEKNINRLSPLFENFERVFTPKEQVNHSYIQPHKAHRLTISHHRSESKQYQSINFSLGYHRLMDNLAHQTFGSQVSFLDADFSLDNNNLSLTHFNLLSLKSFIPITEFNNSPVSWSMDINRSLLYYNNNNFYINNFEMGLGKSKKGNHDTIFYSLLNLGIQYSGNLNTPISGFSGVNLGAIRNHSIGITQFDFKYKKTLFDDEFLFQSAKFKNSFYLFSPNHTLSLDFSLLKINGESQRELSMGYNYHF